jgi:sugar phosphate permease
MAILVSGLIASVEWQTAFWSIGIVGGLIMLILVLMFRSRPSDMGIRAYGAPETEPVHQRRDPVTEKLRAKAFRARMQSTTAFWKLVLIHYLGCVGHAIVIIYVIPIAVQVGVDLVTEAGVLSTLAAVSVLSRFATAVMADYLGAK